MSTKFSAQLVTRVREAVDEPDAPPPGLAGVGHGERLELPVARVREAHVDVAVALADRVAPGRAPGEPAAGRAERRDLHHPALAVVQPPVVAAPEPSLDDDAGGERGVPVDAAVAQAPRPGPARPGTRPAARPARDGPGPCRVRAPARPPARTRRSSRSIPAEIPPAPRRSSAPSSRRVTAASQHVCEMGSTPMWAVRSS